MRRPEVFEYDDGTCDVEVELPRTEEDGKRRRATLTNLSHEKADDVLRTPVRRRRLTGVKPPTGPIDWPAHLTNIPAFMRAMTRRP